MKSVKCDISKIDDNYIEATFQKDCKSVACVLVLQRLIETAPFGEDAEAISQQILNHNKFHSSIQRSLEVDRARDELVCALKARTHAHANANTGLDDCMRLCTIQNVF